MFQIVYTIGLALISIIGVVVFYCVGHAYYQDFRETSIEKRPRKIMWYMATFLAAVFLIYAGQTYASGSEYVQNLYRSWARFEGTIYLGPAENVTLGGTPYEIETETEMAK